ncbi:hypothetical protein [Sphingobacterium sp.]|uniref:hypothetical protein n=1 Tax=Sphingobacterium sp. TaxID=341027 RepID=UPI002FDE3B46
MSFQISSELMSSVFIACTFEAVFENGHTLFVSDPQLARMRYFNEHYVRNDMTVF